MNAFDVLCAQLTRDLFVIAKFLLFAVFLDELSDTCNLYRNRFIVVYADDILLIYPSVVNLENLIHLCERVRYGNRLQKNLVAYVLGHDCDVSCANITSLNGRVLPWTNVIKYLGIHIVQSRAFKCSVDQGCSRNYQGGATVFFVRRVDA